MFEKKKKDKELSTAEVLKEIVKNQKELSERLLKIESKPQEAQPTPEVQPQPEIKQEVKPEIKQEVPKFIVQEIPIKTKKIIVDFRDEKNPKALDNREAIAEILNKITKIEKALA